MEHEAVQAFGGDSFQNVPPDERTMPPRYIVGFRLDVVRNETERLFTG